MREAGECMGEADPNMKTAMHKVKEMFPDACGSNTGVGSTIFAVKPGDGSAREQAASCQKVLGAGLISPRSMQQSVIVQT